MENTSVLPYLVVRESMSGAIAFNDSVTFCPIYLTLDGIYCEDDDIATCSFAFAFATFLRQNHQDRSAELYVGNAV